MTDTESNTQQHHVSPDGQWQWNGQDWVPNTDSSTVPGTPPPSDGDAPKKNWFSRHKVLTGVGAVVALVVIGGAISSGGDTSEPAASTEQTQTTEADTEPVEEQPVDEGVPGVGDAVRDGEFEFTVKDVETGVSSVGNEYLNETAQGKYTVVTVKVENIGSESQMFDSSSQKALDSQGREFSADSAAGLYINENNDSFLNEINPGNTVTVKIVFDVPKGESLSQLELHDSPFSGGVAVQL